MNCASSPLCGLWWWWLIGWISMARGQGENEVVQVINQEPNLPCGVSFPICGEHRTTNILDTSSAQDVRRRRLPQINPLLLVVAARSAKEYTDKLYNETELAISGYEVSDRSRQSANYWNVFTKSSDDIKNLAYSALVSVGATERVLSFSSGLNPVELTLAISKASVGATDIGAVCPRSLIQNCVAGKYRSYSGQCNNVNRPLWGATNEPMARYLLADYADLVNLPRAGSDGFPLPNAAEVSAALMYAAPNGAVQSDCSLMIADWFHMVYNDVAQVAAFKGVRLSPLPCCTPGALHSECLPIEDPRGRLPCMPYARSSPAPREHCLFGPREQLNSVTSFLDGSVIYGSNTETAHRLRLFFDGKIRTAPGDLLPPQENFNPAECASSSSQPCFQTGSDKANLLPTLSALHTLWLRQHNRLATDLKHMNPHWDDERLYQESRRIVGAQIVHITFNEFLPAVIGEDNMKSYGLELSNNGFYTDYDMNVDASVLNSFAAAAGLAFFALYGDSVKQLDRDGSQISNTPLSSAYYNPSLMYRPNGVEGYIRFMLRERSNIFDRHISRELQQLFLRGDASVGIDLPAVIIQMGRDHGISSYTLWRQRCGLKKPASFSDLMEHLREPTMVNTFADLYRSVDDIDLYVGGLAEKPLKGALVGPTLACIISKQFRNLRQGDRFWYENFFAPSAFTEKQIDEIRMTTLARIICENTNDIGVVQQYALHGKNDFENCPVSCDNSAIPVVDITAWIDEEPKVRLPVTAATLSKAVLLGNRLADEIREIERSRLSRRGGVVSTRDANFAHAAMLSASPEAKDIARVSDVMLHTTMVLVRGEDLNADERLPSELDRRTLQQMLPHVDVDRIIGNFALRLEECVPQFLPCDHTSKFRTFSGWCNNLMFHKYGNTFNALRRLLPPDYNDGFNEPRQLDSRGLELPSARYVSNIVHAGTNLPHVRYSHLIMQWGQFLDHDFALSPVSPRADGGHLDCTRCDSFQTVSVNCFPISIPANDPYFPPRNRDGTRRCMSFTRSLVGQLNLGYRNPQNQVTSYIDGSNIYGSTVCEATKLRLFERGLLNFTRAADGLHYGLPQSYAERDCRSLPSHLCFEAGDVRSNEQPCLTCMHTIWMRQHNRIANYLSGINNFWPEEQTYQESRRIVGAMIQHITYNEFLPKVLGCEIMAEYNLTLQKIGYYTGYDERCDATMSAAFTTAAFRFGHSLIRPTLERMDDKLHTADEPLKLHSNFFNPWSLYEPKGVDNLLMGLLLMPSESFDRFLTDEVRNRLFELRNVSHSGLDLSALNIQRGRDHGMPPYNEFREWCGLPRARQFDDLRDSMDSGSVQALRTAYRSVDDIDLFPGIMSERALPGALLGPTSACIVAEQFQRLRKCDRFWYENDNAATRFTPDQLAEIRKITFGKIICQNSPDISKVQPKVFDLPDEFGNAQVSCDQIPEIDLNEWLDRQFCTVRNRIILLGQSRPVTPCVACTCTSEGPECKTVHVNCLEILEEYTLEEIRQDNACFIQCSGLIRERSEL